MNKEEFDKLTAEEKAKLPAHILFKVAYKNIMEERETGEEAGEVNKERKDTLKQMADAYE